MKRWQASAEYVSESAKDQVLADAFHLLQPQNWIFANQKLQSSLLLNKLNCVTTRGPLSLSTFYTLQSYPSELSMLCFYFYDLYKKVNFFLKHTYSYKEVRRKQSESKTDVLETRLSAKFVFIKLMRMQQAKRLSRHSAPK